MKYLIRSLLGINKIYRVIIRIYGHFRRVTKKQ